MFYEGKNIKKIIFTIKGLNTSNVTNMNGMFKECKNLEELDLSTFNTNNVKNMCGMFYGCSSLKELNLSNFNTNKVTNSYGNMFDRCANLKGKITTKDEKMKKSMTNLLKKANK